MLQGREPDVVQRPNPKRKRSRTRSCSPTKNLLLDPSPAGTEVSFLVNKNAPTGGNNSSVVSGAPVNKRPRLLRIEIPSALNSGLDGSVQPIERSEDREDEKNSLFSVESAIGSLFDDIDEAYTSEQVVNLSLTPYEDDDTLSSRHCPPIPGLYFDPSVLLPQELAEEVFSFCMRTYFVSPADNQVMLFGRFPPPSSPTIPSGQSRFPPILLTLLSKLSSLLRPVVPPSTYGLLFPNQPSRARQAIINLYQPGEGITSHVDLLGRYGDGIIGVSLSSGSVMRFDKVEYPQEQSSVSSTEDIQQHNHMHIHEASMRTRWDIYLPERTIIVLSEDARYKWKHGIDKKRRDFVIPELSSTSSSSPPTHRKREGDWIQRGIRMSVTFRWLLPGADVVGDGS